MQQNHNNTKSKKFNSNYIFSFENINYINEILSKFKNNEKDIYHKPEYSFLYEGKLDTALFYIFKNKNNFFFYPFIISNIKGTDFFDISTPYGYGGPITNTVNQDFILQAWEQLNIELKRLNVIAELIKFHPLIKNHIFLKNFYEGKILKVCHTVSLSIKGNDENFLFKNQYSYANRKSINKAIKNNCQIICSNHDQYWEKFIILYEDNLIKFNAKKKYFFKKILYDKLKNSLNQNYQIISCKHNNDIISSLLIIYSNHYAHCHLIGSNSLSKKLSANNLLHHHAVKWCIKNDIHILNFGGGVTNLVEDPVLKFKKSFSKDLYNFYVGERIINHKIYEKLINEKIKNLDNNNLFKYR